MFSQDFHFFGKIFVDRQRFPQGYKGPNDVDAGPDRDCAVENIGGHDDAMFREYVWKLPAPAPTGT